MRKYLIIIAPSSLTEEPYVLNITPDENKGGQQRQKTYTTENLRQDMKDCLNATDDGSVNVLGIVNKTGQWSTQASLSDACAARLGWFE